MSMRPVHTRWFEMLVTHEELTDVMESLATTGCVELEVHDYDRKQMNLQDVQRRLQAFFKLERCYKSLWPGPDTGMSPFNGSPIDILDKALGCIREWESNVRPQLNRLEIVGSKHSRLIGFTT